MGLWYFSAATMFNIYLLKMAPNYIMTSSVHEVMVHNMHEDHSAKNTPKHK